MNFEFNNLMQLQKHFNTELVCIEYLEQMRWKGQPACRYTKEKSGNSKKIKGYYQKK